MDDPTGWNKVLAMRECLSRMLPNESFSNFTPSEFECFFPKQYTGSVRCFGLPDEDTGTKRPVR
jgi:hypothetical protein